MKRAFLSYFIIFIIILVVLCAVSPQIQEICIFLSYNALFFIDNSFSFSKAINPLFAWTIVFALLGLIIGLAKTVSVFKLHKKFYLYSLLGIILLLFLINTCSHPLKYNSSREVREEILWTNLSKNNSYSICTAYISEFPEGKHISDIKLMQEKTLWDSAYTSKSSKVWNLFSKNFKNSLRYSEAMLNYDKVLWSESLKANTANAYATYLNVFPHGLQSNLAQIKLNKYKRLGKATVTVDPIIKPEQAQAVPDNSINVPITNNNDKPNDSDNENSNIPKDYNGKLDLPGGIKYEGYIRNNLPNGFGKEIFQDNSNLKGFYINGKREGEFIYTKSDGSLEKQKFINGNRSENTSQSNEIESKNTVIYNGPRNNGINTSNGEGKEIFPDGTSLSGNYIDGKREGDFVYTKKDGTKENQVFSKGIRIK